MTCWGNWNATWHFISTLFCWCLSAVETLIEWLHEAWDVQSCLFTLKLVVQRKEWSRSLALRSAQVCGASRLRLRNRSWSQPLESMLVFIPARFWTVPEAALQGVYTEICHATSNTVKAPFIIWISWKNLIKYYINSVHMRTEPKDLYRNGSVRIRVPLHP